MDQPAAQSQFQHGAEGGDVEPGVAQRIQSAEGSGKALDPQTQRSMENAFGANFGGVRVHTDHTADTLNRSLNAKAFTKGNDIFFSKGAYNPGSAGGRKLLAHELTHTIQQGSGVQRSATHIQRVIHVGGGMWQEGEDDNFEQLQGNDPTRDVSNPDYNYIGQQGQVTEGTDTYNDILPSGNAVKFNKNNWGQVKGAIPNYNALNKKEKKGIKSRFKKWASREQKVDYRKGKQVAGITTEMVKIGLGKKSEDRRYKDFGDLGKALVGEQKAKENKAKETKLAKKVSKQSQFRNDLAQAMRNIHVWVEQEIVPTQATFWNDLQAAQGKKFKFAYGTANIKNRMQNPVAKEPSANFAMIHDLMFFVGRSAGQQAAQKSDIFGQYNQQTPKRAHVHSPGETPRVGYVGAGAFEKGGQHSLIEDNAFVKSARERNLPLGAGSSNTTDALMTFAGNIGLGGQYKEALAWGAFIFWNKKFKQVEAVRHTFHEIMDVANLRTGGEVRYDMDANNPYDVGYGAKQKNRRAWQAPNQTVPDFRSGNGITIGSAQMAQIKQSLANLANLPAQTLLAFQPRDVWELAAALNMQPNPVFVALQQAVNAVQQNDDSEDESSYDSSYDDSEDDVIGQKNNMDEEDERVVKQIVGVQSTKNPTGTVTPPETGIPFISQGGQTDELTEPTMIEIMDENYPDQVSAWDNILVRLVATKEFGMLNMIELSKYFVLDGTSKSEQKTNVTPPKVEEKKVEAPKSIKQPFVINDDETSEDTEDDTSDTELKEREVYTLTSDLEGKIRSRAMGDAKPVAGAQVMLMRFENNKVVFQVARGPVMESSISAFKAAIK